MRGTRAYLRRNDRDRKGTREFVVERDEMLVRLEKLHAEAWETVPKLRFPPRMWLAPRVCRRRGCRRHRKPMFHLRSADGAFGGHQQAALECSHDFHALTRRILERADIHVSDRH